MLQKKQQQKTPKTKNKKTPPQQQQQPIMLQQYLINIDARLRSRNSTVSVKAETAECLVTRDSIIA